MKQQAMRKCLMKHLENFGTVLSNRNRTKSLQNSDKIETQQCSFITDRLFSCDFFCYHSKDNAWRILWFHSLVFPRSIFLIVHSLFFFAIFFCSYLKTSALASITWTRFIFPPEEASMLTDITNAQRLFLYRERTAMISSTRDG